MYFGRVKSAITLVGEVQESASPNWLCVIVEFDRWPAAPLPASETEYAGGIATIESGNFSALIVLEWSD